MNSIDRWTDSGIRGAAIYALDRAQPDTRADERMAPGPLPVVAVGEVELGGGDRTQARWLEAAAQSEKSDRSRAFDPHLMDLLLPTTQHEHWRSHRWVGPEEEFPLLAEAGLDVTAIEIVRVLDDGEAETLSQLYGGSRGEVTRVIGVLHFRVSVQACAGRSLGVLTSRARQDILSEVRVAFAPFGHLRKETAADLTGASELPFVIASVIGDAAESIGVSAWQLIRERPETVLTMDPWTLAIWPDLAVISGRRDLSPAFRLGRCLHTVVMSVVVDATIIRVAQREVLGALVRRAAQARFSTPAGGESVTESPEATLYRTSVRVRSRLWWPTVGTLGFVREFARSLADTSALAEIATSADYEVRALAEQSHRDLEAQRAVVDERRLKSDRQVAAILMAFTVGAVGLAFVSLVVAIATSADTAAALISGLVAAVTAAVASRWFYGRIGGDHRRGIGGGS